FQLAGYRGTSFNTTGAEGPERIDGAIVTRSFFDILGRGPALGRTLARAGGDREVVLSDAVWRRRFDGARDVLGRTLVLDAAADSIVGVMPPGFEFPARFSEVWASPRYLVPEHPLRPDKDPTLDRGSHYMDVVARLAPGATLASAMAEADAIEARVR